MQNKHFLTFSSSWAIFSFTAILNFYISVKGNLGEGSMQKEDFILWVNHAEMWTDGLLEEMSKHQIFLYLDMYPDMALVLYR